VDATTIFTAYINAGQHYAALTVPYALDLLKLLVFIELITIGLTYVMDSDDPPVLLWRIVRLLFTSGFAYWWITQAWTLGIIVVGSFNQLGQNLTGLPDLTPMHFLQIGTNLAKVIWTAPASDRLMPDVGAALEQVVLCAAVLFIFLVIAAMVTLTLTAFYLILGPASILVGFLPCRFTTSMAEGYFNWLVRTGVILLFFYVVLGTAQTFAQQWTLTVGTACNPTLAITPLAALGAIPIDVHSTVCTNAVPTQMLIDLVADMVILGVICLGIPFMAGSIVSHGVNMTLEHLASARYLATGLARPLGQAIASLSRQISRSTSNNQSKLEQRMAAGAAAAAAMRPSNQATTQLPKPPPNNAFGVPRTKPLVLLCQSL
jgi:P-type conjugative transfer protein TrbL